MRVFVAGATGAVGRRLVPQLVARGHEVVATTRTPAKRDLLRSLGAEPVVMDGLDAGPVGEAVARAEPEVIVHQMTALAGRRQPAALRPRSSRARTSCAPRAPTTCWRPPRPPASRRFVAQSYTGWPNIRAGRAGEDRGRPARPGSRRPRSADRWRRSATSSASVAERAARRASCCATAASTAPAPPSRLRTQLVRKRKCRSSATAPASGRSIHIDDAAAATVAAVEHGAPRRLQHRRRRPGAASPSGCRTWPSCLGREAAAPRAALGSARLAAARSASR